MGYGSVSIEVNVSEFDSEDLISELEDRGYHVIGPGDDTSSLHEPLKILELHKMGCVEQANKRMLKYLEELTGRSV